jgi:prephenate dehydratase
MKIAIQGIPGSFHHQVAINQYGFGNTISNYRTFEEVAKSIYDGKDEVGIMAIENSIAGAILPNYELIDRYGLHILGEYYLPISHNLMCLPGQTINQITEVKSHPMALLQCKLFFQDYPHISLIDDIDTATVAKRIFEEKIKGVGAIASKTAAEIYHLEILAEDIQTVQSNFTRFILLGKLQAQPGPIPNKASIKVTISNEKGSLAKLLTLMSENGLDLSKIQSIPVIDKPWDYAFFIDTQFDDYQIYSWVMKEIAERGGEVKVLGEYLSGR